MAGRQVPPAGQPVASSPQPRPGRGGPGSTGRVPQNAGWIMHRMESKGHLLGPRRPSTPPRQTFPFTRKGGPLGTGRPALAEVGQEARPGESPASQRAHPPSAPLPALRLEAMGLLSLHGGDEDGLRASLGRSPSLGQRFLVQNWGPTWTWVDIVARMKPVQRKTWSPRRTETPCWGGAPAP